jgi:hypothetical protein
LLSAVLAGLAGASVSIGAGVIAPHEAHASVSIAVAFDALVKDADTVAIVTPLESKSLWEDGRIYTYTRLKVEQGVAGELGTGSEGWVRTMGGVVGKIGQLVDGEAVFTPGKSSLIFMRKLKDGSTWEVAARAQGQYPVVIDSSSGNAKLRKLVRSAAVGVLFPPKTPVAAPASGASVADVKKPVRLASDVIHDRPVDDVTREIATSWKTLHTTATPAK